MTPLRHYQKLIDSGVLRGDDHQTRIIQGLQDLHDQLVDYQPPDIQISTPSNSLVCIRPSVPLLNMALRPDVQRLYFRF